MVIPYGSGHVGQHLLIRATITEHTEKIRFHPKQMNILRYSIQPQIETVATVIIRKAILRKCHSFHTWTMPQTFGKFHKMPHIIVLGQIEIISSRLESKLTDCNIIAMFRIKTHRGIVNTKSNQCPVHNVPKHHKDQQQFRKKEKAGTPFILNLNQYILHMSFPPLIDCIHYIHPRSPPCRDTG